jgi:hypothetical protein
MLTRLPARVGFASVVLILIVVMVAVPSSIAVVAATGAVIVALVTLLKFAWKSPPDRD